MIAIRREPISLEFETHANEGKVFKIGEIGTRTATFFP